MARDILFETYRGNTDEEYDSIRVEKYGDGGYAIEAWKSRGGGLVFIGFTPAEFTQFIEAIDGEKGYTDGR